MSDNGELGKAVGMSRSYQHADPMWKAAAARAVVAAARRQPTLTADDVMALIPPSLTTHEKRALGGIMRGAAVAGVIERTDRTVLCTRANCHRAPITVWKSLMFRGSP
jgi:hypothetical protein